MRELLAELMRSLAADRPVVWCAVVETRGSTPQKPGAAMLVFPDGSQAGTLGGGCVEAEVKQRALGVLGSDARPEILSFSLDGDYGWDDGLICGGRMLILADPLGRDTDYFRTYHQIVQAGQGCIEAIAVSEQPAGVRPGSRYLFDATGQLAAQRADGPVPALVTEQLPPLARRPRASVIKGIAYLPVLPRIRLLIVGGGHVGQAVAQLAASVDFDVWVLDDRAAIVSAERFPLAQRRIVGDIGGTLPQLAQTDVNAATYCIIVTRGHAHDEEALYHLAPTPASYVGLIGSKRKIKLIYEDLLARGIPQEVLARVHAPLGLAIGSQTVPEIAVSIVAELIARRNLGQTSEVVMKRPQPAGA